MPLIRKPRTNWQRRGRILWQLSLSKWRCATHTHAVLVNELFVINVLWVQWKRWSWGCWSVKVYELRTGGVIFGFFSRQGGIYCRTRVLHYWQPLVRERGGQLNRRSWWISRTKH